MRHVYQTSAGGKTFCPLEREARIVVTSTPRFAKVVANKFARSGSTQVESDLAENHGRRVARSYLQNLAEAVGSIVQAKEETWHYATPRLTVPVHTVAIGPDGTCLLLCEEGYRQAMVGSISLYDRHGERVHTIYVGAPRSMDKPLLWSGWSGRSPMSSSSIRRQCMWGSLMGRRAIGSFWKRTQACRSSIFIMPQDISPRWPKLLIPAACSSAQSGWRGAVMNSNIPQERPLF